VKYSDGEQWVNIDNSISNDGSITFVDAEKTSCEVRYRIHENRMIAIEIDKYRKTLGFNLKLPRDSFRPCIIVDLTKSTPDVHPKNDTTSDNNSPPER
jgi:hypothetical protein